MAIREEVNDLVKAGTPIIQIDEAVSREGLPLKQTHSQAYLDWAVKAFLLCSSGVRDDTQMCYSEFNDIIKSIADLNADVITIEPSLLKHGTARSLYRPQIPQRK